MDRPAQSVPSRRQFLQSSAAAAAVGSLALPAAFPGGAHAAGSDVLKIGLVGCGGRGTGAAVQTLTADKYTKLVAMADAFEDKVQSSLDNIKKTEVAEQVDVTPDRMFSGFDGYKGVIENSDLVLLATPPYFRPAHLRACIEAGKHVFAEKPVAVDGPGIRSVLETTELAKKKNLAIVSGLCWRYETGMLETMKQLHSGAIGKPLSLEAMRLAGGVWVRKRADLERQAGRKLTEMEYQMRNWYYFTWLSGDFIVEQFVHQLDQLAWALRGEYPTRCYCLGGRQTRTGEDTGHVYDHFSAVYEYESGARAYAATRHQQGCSNMTHGLVTGTEGSCNLEKYTITGTRQWKWPGRRTVMHQLEHNAMYEALRKGKIINNGEYMAKSTMMAIIARMSAYTGKTLTWEQAMNSTEALDPDRLAWDGTPPPAEVAMPGITPFK